MDDDAVWSRVFAPSAGGRWEERLLWDCDALGEDLRHLPPLGREQQKISALLPESTPGIPGTYADPSMPVLEINGKSAKTKNIFQSETIFFR